MSLIPLDILIEAKREVALLARQGKLLLPKDAWLASGHTAGYQTLWSVSRRIAEASDVPAQELCEYLENQYPQHAGMDSPKVEWHDIIHKTKH